MRSERPKMLKQVGIGAASIFKCVRQHGKPASVEIAFRKRPLLVDSVRHPDNEAILPLQQDRGDGHGAKRQWAEDTVEQCGLSHFLLGLAGAISTTHGPRSRCESSSD